MSELRRRQGQTPKDDEGPSISSPVSPQDKINKINPSTGSGKILPVFLLLGATLIIFIVVYSLQTGNSEYLGSPEEPRIYTPSELAHFSGKEEGKDYAQKWWWPWRRRQKSRLLLGCMGKVFDVTPGWRHYGPNGGYSFFSGRDASRSFVTGDFENDLTDDISNLSVEDISAIFYWRDFYENSKEYKYVGKLVGRFYNNLGDPVPLLLETEKLVAEYKAQEAAKEAAAANEVAEILCNVSWKKKEGGWVYCNDGLVPRKTAMPKLDDKNSGSESGFSSSFDEIQERCICVDSQDKDTEGRKVYEGCRAESSRCQTSAPGED